MATRQKQPDAASPERQRRDSEDPFGGEAPGVPAVANGDHHGYVILSRQADDLREIMQANLGTGGMSAFDLDRIRVPAQGGTLWTLNTLEGETSAREMEGIILHWKEPRVYFARPIEETGGKEPPDCASTDGVVGIGSPGGACAKCAYAAWGSDPKGGRGQACKQKRLLFFLRPGNMLPDALFLPPTSIKPIKQYFLRLASQQVPFYAVRTKLGLQKVQNGSFPYAQVVAGMAGRLEPQEVEVVRAYIHTLRPAFDAVRPEQGDVSGEE